MQPILSKFTHYFPINNQTLAQLDELAKNLRSLMNTAENI